MEKDKWQSVNKALPARSLPVRKSQAPGLSEGLSGIYRSLYLLLNFVIYPRVENFTEVEAPSGHLFSRIVL